MDNLLLKNIVNRHFKVDLDNNSKDPVIFTARSVYSGIAKSYSLRVTEIGRSITDFILRLFGRKDNPKYDRFK